MARTAASANEVRGLQTILRELRQFNPDVLKELRKDLQDQAQPIIKAAGARVPEPATSGWSDRGRTGFRKSSVMSGMKVSLRASKRVKGVRGSYAVVELVQSNAAGAIWDQAGTRGNYKAPTQRGINFVDALNRSGGKAQRGLWPASVGRRKDIAKAFEATIRAAERKANAKMQAARI
jgi:hypothetical protein